MTTIMTRHRMSAGCLDALQLHDSAICLQNDSALHNQTRHSLRSTPRRPLRLNLLPLRISSLPRLEHLPSKPDLQPHVLLRDVQQTHAKHAASLERQSPMLRRLSQLLDVMVVSLGRWLVRMLREARFRLGRLLADFLEEPRPALHRHHSVIHLLRKVAADVGEVQPIKGVRIVVDEELSASVVQGQEIDLAQTIPCCHGCVLEPLRLYVCNLRSGNVVEGAVEDEIVGIKLSVGLLVDVQLVVQALPDVPESFAGALSQRVADLRSWRGWWGLVPRFGGWEGLSFVGRKSSVIGDGWKLKISNRL